MHSPILIAAYGNALAGDDAFGPLVAEALHAQACAEVEVVSLGMRPAALLDHLADRSALCVVDAAWCDQQPAGTLLEMDFFAADRPELVYDRALSTHGLSVLAELQLARQLGLCPPQVRLVAVVAATAQVGCPPSAAVRQQVPVAVRRIADWARHVRCA
ncbi:MAG: hydrogenase maturation protease [Pirellulaceae bacterium]|jgi:hydrogenase maturation protease|nr:hydrogenase maturation protease [Pirellulaceae bacterium]